MALQQSSGSRKTLGLLHLQEKRFFSIFGMEKLLHLLVMDASYYILPALRMEQTRCAYISVQAQIQQILTFWRPRAQRPLLVTPRGIIML